MHDPRISQRTVGSPIYVVSGGTGATGELLVRTVLAQFRDVDVPLIIKNHVLTFEEIDSIVEEIADAGGTIVHTMVNAACREYLADRAADRRICSVDLVAELLGHLEAELGQQAAGQPGLYRTLHRSYFERIEAIEFAVAHDDAQRLHELGDADIILIGVSRVGKTPLSIYLSILGWKTANIPFILGVPLPQELATIAPRRIVGLMIEAGQLMSHRRWRQTHLGIPEGEYVDRTSLVEELRAANHFFHKAGIPVVDVTQKPIETAAEEVVAHIT